MENLKQLIDAAGLEYWLAAPLIYIVALVRRVLDAIGVKPAIESVGAKASGVFLSEDFWPAIRDIVWGCFTVGIALVLAAVAIKVRMMEGNWLVVGFTHGIGSIAIYTALKKAGVTDFLKLSKPPKPPE